MDIRAGRLRWLAMVGAVAVCAAIVPPQMSNALLTAAESVDAELASGSIFAGERVTSAFAVVDRSASQVDRSNALAFAGDGRITTTGAWTTAFAADRYLELDVNAPLPAGLAVNSATFTLRFSSADPLGVACHYFEVRRISSGATLATHGGPGQPVACATGTTWGDSTTALPSIDVSELANDLRIRVYVRDTTGAAIRLDRATVSGGTPYSSFELYPVVLRDAADGSPAEILWELAGP